jgi:hypothetical protein
VIRSWQFFVGLAVVASAFAADTAPVKLEVIPDRDTLRAGEQVTLEVRLLNAANQPATPRRPFHVLLQARLPSGKVQALRTVDLPAGQSTHELALPVPGPGVVYIWAKNPELLPGGAYVRVRGGANAPVQAQPPPAQSQPRVQVQAERPRGGLMPAPVMAPPPLAPAPSPASALQIALRYSPDRAFLADGNDAVTVHAFLTGDADAAPHDIRLNVFDSSGSLHPTPLTIPQGAASGHAILTSSQPGDVTVEYLGSAPPASVEGDRKLQIHFRPAITKIDLKASPPGISLFDTADLVVTLTAADGRPIVTDSPLAVSLAIGSGRGTIETQQLNIPAGSFEARTRFLPGMSGAVSVSAASPNLLTVTAPINVSLPLVLLLLSALGGAAGGYLAYVKHKRAGVRQVWIGCITGFVFYWAAVSLGLASVSRGVALNPLGALVLSIAGGWLQTKVLSMLTSRLTPRAAKAG